MCIWKHWKTPKNKAKNLIKLGVPAWSAWKTAYLKGYAKPARCDYFYYRTFEGRVYGRTLPDLAKKELRKNGLMETVHVVKEIDPEQYLLVWVKVPELEQLAKTGLGKMVEECIQNDEKVVNSFHHRLFGGLKRILGIILLYYV